MNYKKVILNILLDLVFLTVFNVIFFVLGGTEHSASVWISYGFIHFSYVMVLLTPILTRNSTASVVFGVTIASVSSVYFIIEFVIGVIFILINSDSIKVSLITQVIIAGIYLVLLLVNMIANESTADALEKQKNDIAFIKNSSSRVNMLMNIFDDKKTNKAIEKAYDFIHSSPSKSCAEALQYENEVNNKIAELENAVKAKDKNLTLRLADEIVSLMEERNRRVRTAK